jgi:hypothetical protein
MHLLALLFLIPALLFSTQNSLIEKGDKLQFEGERADNFKSRENNFNQALASYLVIASQPGVRSAPLSDSIGTLFFQLGETPWAIYYFEKARALDPQNELYQNHLSLAQTKMGLQPPPQSWIDWTQPLPQKISLLFWTLLLCIALWTVCIWKPSRFLKIAVYLSAGAAALAGLQLMVSAYLAPIYGILIQGTGLYAAPGINEPQILNIPLIMGSKLKVLEAIKEGYWLKVMEENGAIGYVPASSIRLIAV